MAQRNNPWSPYNYLVKLGDDWDETQVAGGFSTLSGIGQTVKVAEYRSGNDPANPASLSPEQARTIDEFRAEMVATRQQLRAVQAALRHDIEWLKAILEFCDIALVPILVAVAAMLLGALRLRRRHRRQTQPALA